jgi:hypothetical protein
MPKPSIRDRLAKLEDQRRFRDWFVRHRFYATLTFEELETCASGGGLPDPIPNRPSSVDTLDRKSLLKLWEEDELKFVVFTVFFTYTLPSIGWQAKLPLLSPSH